MDSLEELCYQKFYNFMMKAPPLLQEMIIKETKDRMKKKIKKEIQQEITDDNNKKIQFLIPEIIADIMYTNKHYIERTDFYKKYPKICTKLIRSCILTAELSVNRIEETHTLRHTFQDRFYLNSLSSDSDSNSNSSDDEVYGYPSESDHDSETEEPQESDYIY